MELSCPGRSVRTVSKMQTVVSGQTGLRKDPAGEFVGMVHDKVPFHSSRGPLSPR